LTSFAEQVSRIAYDEHHLTVSVLVPTYRRPQDLLRCIRAIAAQERVPDEVIVVVRDIDAETWMMVDRIRGEVLPSLRTIRVDVPGQVQALNAGLALATGDIIAITDDDAEPHADWVARIVAHFERNPDVAGVGGRDFLHVNNVLQQGQERIVGRVPYVGRHRGNHHLGYGPAREVDVLKGVNGSYRTVALREIGFDTRLRGTGAQVHWEISLCLALKRRGWKLLYDPAVAVNHYLAPRFDEDQRTGFNSLALRNAVFNETFIRIEHLSPVRRVFFMAWGILLGTRASPGLVQWLRFLPSQRGLSGDKFLAALFGRRDAWLAVREMVRENDTAVQPRSGKLIG